MQASSVAHCFCLSTEMDALEFKMFGKLMIFMIIAFGAVASKQKQEGHCSASTKRFCSCNSTEPITLHSICQFRGRCVPCSVDYVDPINCKDCPGNKCRVCPEKEVSLELSNKGSDTDTGDEIVRSIIRWNSGRQSRDTGEWDPPEDFWCKINRESHGPINCTIKSHRKECSLLCGDGKYYTFECSRKELVWKPEFKACEALEEDVQYLQKREIPEEVSSFSTIMTTNEAKHEVLPLKYESRDLDTSVDPTTGELEFKSLDEMELTNEVKTEDDPKSNANSASSSFIWTFLNSVMAYVSPKNDKVGAIPVEPNSVELKFKAEEGSEMTQEVKSTYEFQSKNSVTSFLASMPLQTKHMHTENNIELSTPVELNSAEFKYKASKASEMIHEVKSTFSVELNESVASSFPTSMPPLSKHMYPENNKVRATPVELLPSVLEYKTPQQTEMSHEAKSLYDERLNEISFSTSIPLEIELRNLMSRGPEFTQEDNASDDTSKLHNADLVVTAHGTEPKDKYPYVTENQNKDDAQFKRGDSLLTTGDFLTELTTMPPVKDSKSNADIVLPAGILLLQFIMLFIAIAWNYDRDMNLI